jgi:hypothetical protein
MAHLRAVQPAPAASPAAPTTIRDVLYKADHVRAIDRYIDFFGTGRPLTVEPDDPCGDRFLESLA